MDEKLLADFGKLQLQREATVRQLEIIEQQMGQVRRQMLEVQNESGKTTGDK